MRVRREAKGWGKIISKKIPQGRGTEFLCKIKNSSERNIQYYNIHHTDFKST